MARLGVLVLVIFASLAMPNWAWSEDASDVFLKAYQDFQTAEKFEREARPRDALAKYRAAQLSLQEVGKSSPDWQPLVVEYRLKKTQENIRRLEGEVAALPVQPEGIEGALPEADVEKASTPMVSSDPVVRVKPPVESRRAERVPRAPLVEEGSSGGTSVERQLRELRSQLAEARADTEKLNERLLKKSADLQSALVEIDKTKVNVVELKSQLVQATSALEDTQKDGDSFGAIREQFDKRIVAVLSQLTEAEADKEVLQEENARYLAKLERASKYILDSDAIRANLLKERGGLAEARDTALSRTKRIKDNVAEVERVSAENKKLKGDLAAATKDNVSREQYEKLEAESVALAKKLAASDKALADSKSSDNPEKDKLIASLQSDLNGVNDKLLEAQAATSQADEQMKGLQKQLDESSGELAQLKLNPSPTKEEKNLITENELLRGIILRQIKEQTLRDEAKKQLEQEIATLQIKSEVINSQLAVLGAPLLQLTPEERSLFKEPVALLSEPGMGSLEVAVVIAKPDATKTPAEAVAPPSQNNESLPEDVREMVQKAKSLFEEKNYAETEKVYQLIVEKIPGNYFALSNLAAVQIESGKLSAAEVALKKAVEINDKDSFAFTNLGILYSRQGKFDAAMASLGKALNLNDKDSVAHNYLGVCMGQKDQRNDAEKQFKRAIELDDDYPDAHFNLAVLYATTQPQSMELAKHYYNRATELGAAPDPSLERLIQ